MFVGAKDRIVTTFSENGVKSLFIHLHTERHFLGHRPSWSVFDKKKVKQGKMRLMILFFRLVTQILESVDEFWFCHMLQNILRILVIYIYIYIYICVCVRERERERRERERERERMCVSVLLNTYFFFLFSSLSLSYLYAYCRNRSFFTLFCKFFASLKVTYKSITFNWWNGATLD